MPNEGSVFPEEEISPADWGSDVALRDVFTFFRRQRNMEARIGEIVRRAFDEVIMGPGRGRFFMADVDPTEKTYVGIRVQLLIEGEFELAKGQLMDCSIEGQEVDVKFSLRGDWMIPREAINHICLLLTGDEKRAIFSVGLVRATEDKLRAGNNQDLKRSLNTEGKRQIKWLVKEHPMPENFFIGLGPAILTELLRTRSGQRRINELFRIVQNKPVPRIAIATLAMQDDPMKRVRDARSVLKRENILVLCGRYGDQKTLAAHAGFQLSSRECMSISCEQGRKAIESAKVLGTITGDMLAKIEDIVR